VAGGDRTFRASSLTFARSMWPDHQRSAELRDQLAPRSRQGCLARRCANFDRAARPAHPRREARSAVDRQADRRPRRPRSPLTDSSSSSSAWPRRARSSCSGSQLGTPAGYRSPPGQSIERLRGESACAALCGASPVLASSGQRPRVIALNSGGDRQPNRALHLIAVCATASGPARTRDAAPLRTRRSRRSCAT
jgi:transposase